MGKHPRASRSHWDYSRLQKRATTFFFGGVWGPWAPCWGQPLRACYTGTLVLFCEGAQLQPAAAAFGQLLAQGAVGLGGAETHSTRTHTHTHLLNLVI